MRTRRVGSPARDLRRLFATGRGWRVEAWWRRGVGFLGCIRSRAMERVVELATARERDVRRAEGAYGAFCALVVTEDGGGGGGDDDDDFTAAADGGGGFVRDVRAYVVSAASGTKCAALRHRSREGDGVADAHAETLAVRAFRRWLHGETRALAEGRRSVWTRAEGGVDERGGVGAVARVRLRRGVAVHAYCSQSPCGDASVFRVPDGASAGPGADPGADARGRVKRAKTTGAEGGGAGTTGAKIWSAETLGGGGGSDPERERATQERGAIRWKPGRGDPSFCLSCSDKLCRWQMVGLQGKLLRLIAPEAIRLRSISVAIPRVREEFEDETKRVVQEALKRAIVDRVREDGREGDEEDAPTCVAVPPGSDGSSSYDAVVAGAGVASPISSVYIAPPSHVLTESSSVTAPKDAKAPPRVERILGAVGYLAGFNKKCRANGAAASSLSARRLCESFDRDVLSHAHPSVRESLRAKSYAQVKATCAALAGSPPTRRNPVAVALLSPLPGKDKSFAESFIPFP